MRHRPRLLQSPRGLTPLLVSVALTATVTSAYGATAPRALAPGAGSVTASTTSTPQARCGPGSLPETGLQGEVPLADQLDGRSTQGYRCNLELAGQSLGDGAALMLAWYGHCAYVPTGYAATDPDFKAKKGVIVLDVTDPRHPKETARLQTAAMINPWESLKVDERTGLLAAGEGGSFPVTGPGSSGPTFDLYDVKTDCTHPKLLASTALPDAHGHEGDWAPDGRTYYQSTLRAAPAASIVAIDVTTPEAPHEVATFASPLGPVHALNISKDGNRAYFGIAAFNGSSLGNDGVVIADTSEVQARKPHPRIKVISSLFWKDGSEAQLARHVVIHGHPYLVTTDEFGAQANPHDACAMGQNPYGFVHLVDIGDERHPRLAGTARLEVNDPANCATVLSEQNTALSLMYSSHYCTPDDPDDTTVIACSWISSGIRLFDVRDPAHPKEIAYYNPPARLDAATVRGSAPVFEALIGTRTKDSTSTQVRWVKDARSGRQELWFISSAQGFQVLRFTNGAYPLAARPAAAPVVRAPAAAPPAPAAPVVAVTRPSRTTRSLAATGASGQAAAWGAVALAAAGLVLLATRRRRDLS